MKTNEEELELHSYEEDDEYYHFIPDKILVDDEQEQFIYNEIYFSIQRCYQDVHMKINSLETTAKIICPSTAEEIIFYKNQYNIYLNKLKEYIWVSDGIVSEREMKAFDDREKTVELLPETLNTYLNIDMLFEYKVKSLLQFFHMINFPNEYTPPKHLFREDYQLDALAFLDEKLLKEHITGEKNHFYFTNNEPVGCRKYYAKFKSFLLTSMEKEHFRFLYTTTDDSITQIHDAYEDILKSLLILHKLKGWISDIESSSSKFLDCEFLKWTYSRHQKKTDEQYNNYNSILDYEVFDKFKLKLYKEKILGEDYNDFFLKKIEYYGSYVSASAIIIALDQKGIYEFPKHIIEGIKIPTKKGEYVKVNTKVRDFINEKVQFSSLDAPSEKNYSCTLSTIDKFINMIDEINS